jgi:lipoprotein-anchoring transpeptidase ErfK/SrfK
VEGEEEPGKNNLWYRVWGGYLNSAYVQPTRYSLNPISDIPPCGKLSEVTVPYTQAYQYSTQNGWEKDYRLYYSTTHWITDIQTGPDGSRWYKLTSELTEHLNYFVPCEHLRPVPDREFIPTSIHVPDHEKRVEVSLGNQSLTAFEFGQPVYSARLSSGLGSKDVPKGTRTPAGRHYVQSKSPSKHMGGINATGAPGDFVLPGVPWTTFFIYESGVAFHGAYWHNNFGHQMSHGCVNLHPLDAKWLFNWVTPVYDPPYRDHCSWDVRGRGTLIVVS